MLNRKDAKNANTINKKTVLVFLFVLAGFPCLHAQEPAKQQQTQEQPEPASEPQKPAGEGFKWGLMEGHSEFEIGYRWVPGAAGSRDMYRSMINLGQGPKLLRSTLSLRSNYGTGALFDRLDLSLNSWGGDPYNTMHLSVSRMDLYEFRADYRNLNYYNFIPSYSNPLFAKGNLLGQHSLNVTNRTTDLELMLFPRSKVRPYFAYARSSGFGPGFTTYRSTGNEFLLDTAWAYSADDYRGGVELSLSRLNLTLEQGYRVLRNDTSASRNGRTTGNNSQTFLGQSVVLDDLDRSYHDRTKIPITKLIARYAPFDNLSITGRYIYSMADVESNLDQIETGNLLSLEDLLLYKTASDSFDTSAKRPSNTGGFVIEFSPFSRLTLMDSFDARSYHISGTALLASTFYNFRPMAGLPPAKNDVRVDRIRESSLAYDQIRNQAEFEFELGYGLALRAGHRYTSVETTLQDIAGEDRDSESGRLTQQTAIGGFSFSRGRWLRLALDYENNQTDRALTRTDLLDYDQFRFDWRLRLRKSFSASGRVGFVRNSNNQSDIDFSSHNRNYTVALNYEPGERCYLSLDYSRTNLYSNLAILLPQTLDADRSMFDERAHGVGGSIGVEIYRRARIDFGYRGILNAGSYPLNYHQPFASVSIPLRDRLVWKTHWQYFGYNEKGSSLQDHRSHLLTVSLAYAY